MSESTPISAKWLPSDWMDEATPEPQEDPSAFIKGPVGDLYRVAPDEADDDDWYDSYEMRLAPGAIVKFDLCRVWPPIEVDIGPDGKILRHDPIPEGATLFWTDHDPDTISESLEILIEEYEPEEGTLDVVPYDWSLSANFCLIVDEAGARFVKINEAA